MITLVFFPFLILELEDELSLLDFLCLRENRDGLFFREQISINLLKLKENPLEFSVFLSKLTLFSFKVLLKTILLHLLVLVLNRVKSLMLELLCNSSCFLRERGVLSALNRCFLLREHYSSQKLLSVIYRAREFDLEINSYLYLHKAKQEKKEKAYNNIYKSIGVILLISL